MKAVASLLILLFLSAFLISVVAGTQLINSAKANPYIGLPGKSVPPDAKTKPPSIAVSSPINATIYSRNNLTLALNVSVGESTTAIQPFINEIYYKVDWQPNFTDIYRYIPDASIYPSPTISTFTTAIEIAEIPDGNHDITIYSKEIGSYRRGEGLYMFFDSFEIANSKSVRFTVDTISPSISILSPENKTYDVANVTLNFSLNEAASQVYYVLDGEEGFPFEGNMTLTGLIDGEHNVTVYATDAAGNAGSSETVYFTVKVPDPFPILPVALAIAAAVVVAAGLLVYFKRRR